VISLLGLNDLHGKITALPAFAGYVQNLRELRAAEGGAVVVVDAGDMFQGTLESNATEGAVVVAAYGKLGVTAAALGNHEFDYGPVGTQLLPAAGDPQGALKARIREASFPMLCANLVDRGTRAPVSWPGLQPSALIEVAGVKLGFVGVVTTRTPKIVTRAYFANLDVTPLAEAILRETAILRARGAQAVIALAHAGADCKAFDDPRDLSSCADEEIFAVARALPAGGVDAIVAGHSHAGVAHVVNEIPIVEAYAHGRAFSRIDFRIEPGRSSAQLFPPHWLCPDEHGDPSTCELPTYAGRPVLRHDAVARVIEPALAQAAERRLELLGVLVTRPVTAVPERESPLGNLVADLMLASVQGADLAITNGGGLRADLPAGPLTYGSLHGALPFDNLLATMEVSAADLAAVLERHLKSGRHGIVSISGVRVRASCRAGELRVKLERRDGRGIRPDTRLIVATSNYLADGGDGLFEPLLEQGQQFKIDPSKGMREEVAQRLRERGGVLDGQSSALLDPSKPRLLLPSPRPVTCSP
jgi:5'-nucleotidase